MNRVCLLLLMASGVSCGDSEVTIPACVDTLAADCAPLYEPTYEELYSRTLKPTCGVQGTACHGNGGQAALTTGLIFADPDEAYSLLLSGASGGRAPVVASDARCSLVMVRISSAEPSIVMPPGAPLSAEEQCVFQRWIENGAMR